MVDITQNTRRIRANTDAIKENLAVAKKFSSSPLRSSLDKQRQELQGFSREVDGIFSNVLSGIERDFRKTLDIKTIFRNGLDRTLNQVQGVVQQSLTQSIQQSIAGNGGGVGGNLLGGFSKALSGLFGGARAGGGPVSPGQAFLVGERGPELFVPNNAGQINANGSGRGGINIVMNIATPDVGGFQNSQGQLMAEAVQAMRRAGRDV